MRHAAMDPSPAWTQALHCRRRCARCDPLPRGGRCGRQLCGARCKLKKEDAVRWQRGWEHGGASRGRERAYVDRALRVPLHFGRLPAPAHLLQRPGRLQRQTRRVGRVAAAAFLSVGDLPPGQSLAGKRRIGAQPEFRAAAGAQPQGHALGCCAAGEAESQRVRALATPTRCNRGVRLLSDRRVPAANPGSRTLPLKPELSCVRASSSSRNSEPSRCLASTSRCCVMSRLLAPASAVRLRTAS